MRIFPLTALFLLAACKEDVPPPLTAGMTAPQAVTAAAKGEGVEGTFSLMVRSMTMVGSTLYLNSQMDGRDPRNLTVVIEPEAVAGLRDKFGDSPQVVLKGRDIWVKGTAQRVQTETTDFLKPTGTTNYQTQIKVTDPDQISIPAN